MQNKLELLKLMYGQEMVGSIREENDTYVVLHPYFLLPHSDGVMLISSTIYGEQPPSITIPKSSVMFKTNIKDKLYEPIAKKWYQSIHGFNLQDRITDVQ